MSRDPVQLTDDRRYDVATTIISCQLPSAMLQEWITQDHPFTRELARMRHVDVVDLPTGHRPQFTRPRELADAVLATIG